MMSSLRRLAVGLLASSTLIGCGGGGGSSPAPSPSTVPVVYTIVKVEAAPQSGFQWPYYLVVPGGALSTTLIVEPNTTGTGHDDPAVHDEAARRLAEQRLSLAQAVGCALLVPTFPRPYTNWRLYTHALDRDTLETSIANLVRLDLQLLAMVDDARSQLAGRGTSSGERFFIMGFSASGMFANRFCALHPRRIKGAMIGSPGGWPIAPVGSWDGETLRYHIGVADLADLVGTPFDLAAFRTVPLFLYMGDQDTNDSVPFLDSYEVEERELVDRLFGTTPLARWPRAEEIYRSVGCNSTFRLYPGVGHTISSAMLSDIIAFIRAHL